MVYTLVDKTKKIELNKKGLVKTIQKNENGRPFAFDKREGEILLRSYENQEPDRYEIRKVVPLESLKYNLKEIYEFIKQGLFYC